jgi:hypothetical protein
MAEAPAPKQVAIVRADGTPGYVPSSDVAAEVDAGAEVISSKQAADIERGIKRQQEYGGLAGGAAATGLGVARGLTLGASDWAASRIGGDSTREALAGYKEVNPGLSMAGEITGAVAPVLLSGGAGLAAEGLSAGNALRVAGAIPRAVAAGGRAIEAGVAGAIGARATAMGRIGAKALSSAAAGIVEGAAYGVGAEISDSTLKNETLTSEKLLAAAGHGALFGGVIAGGLGGGMAAMGELGGAAARKLASNKSIAQWLDDESGKAFYRSTGATKKMAEKADKYGPGFAEYGKTWRDELPELIGRKVRSTEDLVEGAILGKAKHGKAIGEVLDQVDVAAAAQGKLPKVMAVAGDVESVAARLEATTPGSEPIVNSLRRWADGVKKITGTMDRKTGELVADAADRTMSFKQLQEFRIKADDVWAPKGNPPPELAGFKKEIFEVRQALEKRVEEGVASLGGDKLGKEYESAKKGYQAYSALQKAAASGEARGATNLALGLTDKISASAGAVAGGMIGGLPGTIVGSVVGGAVNKMVRSPAAGFVTAEIAQKLSRLATMERVAATVDKRMTDGIAGFFTRGKQAVREQGASFGTSEKKAIAQRAQEVHALAQNPVAMQSHVERAIGPLGKDAPNVAASLAVKSAAAYSFLASKVPKGRVNGRSLTPQLEKTRFSDYELLTFDRYMSGIRDPLSVFDDMKKGKLSREKVEAVREVYPEMYVEMQEKVWDHVASQGEKLPYEKRIQLGIMFGIPTDETLDPAFMMTLQESAAGGGGGPGAESAPADPSKQMGGRRPAKLDTDIFQTSAEAVEAR